MTTPAQKHSVVARIVEAFLSGNLSVLMIVVSLIAGIVALWVTPREEEPQIVVPLADVIVQMPGARRRRGRAAGLHSAGTAALPDRWS